ncbi:hypothetical protein GCM10010862_12930 [Devosia nitrariae]|uniref:Anti-sigma factor NepR domain-containing protein n=1 Tax=Devosia nitrariae TaxID=2071872 RepID=A0ABQ5W2C9_9HYPH|nr:hypothetical protein GCM10010862_12930 [Devosia nitrariae]
MIQRHAAAEAMRVQLRRMQAFAIPDDREGVFRRLLDKLDRAAADKAPGHRRRGPERNES